MIHFIEWLVSSLYHAVVAIIYIVLLVMALLSIFSNRRLSQTVKLLWVIVIFVAPFIGSLLYLLWGKNQRY